ncbi:hypothetical protein Vi05172_g754 [Venturia inaequalis]|nr:hypothetical protein Vi05172_g754 [Venturia inaequalis]
MKFSILTTAMLPLIILASPLALPVENNIAAPDTALSQEGSKIGDSSQSGTCSIRDPWFGQAVICSQTPSPRSNIVYKFTGKSIPVECYSPAKQGGSTGPLSSIYFRVSSPNGPCYIADGDMELKDVCKGMF